MTTAQLEQRIADLELDLRIAQAELASARRARDAFFEANIRRRGPRRKLARSKKPTLRIVR
jgi:hypothetical protein